MADVAILGVDTCTSFAFPGCIASGADNASGCDDAVGPNAVLGTEYGFVDKVTPGAGEGAAAGNPDCITGGAPGSFSSWPVIIVWFRLVEFIPPSAAGTFVGDIM